MYEVSLSVPLKERRMDKLTHMKVAKKHLRKCDVDQISLTLENVHYKPISWKLCGPWC